MSDKDNQYVVFHNGEEVEFEPELIKKEEPKPVVQETTPAAPIHKVDDIPYIDRSNEPVSYEPNFVLQGDATQAEPQFEEVAAAGHEEEYKRAARKEHRRELASSYVTKKFMVICLVIAIVVSTLLGAGVSTLIGGGSDSSKAHDNLSESDISAATGSKLTVAQIVEKNADAVVEIVVESTSVGMFGQTELTEGAGSGVIVNKEGYIVTNYHVIEGARAVTVTLHNGDEYKATIVGGDDANDLAVIKINGKNLKVATLGDSSKLVVGDLAVAIGNPLGQLGGTATSGIISALDRELTIENRTLTLLQTDAAVNPGNSGGGLFNGAGELIGIVESKTSATGIEGLAFALPINALKDEIDQLIANGKVSGKPSIGISIYDISESNAEYYNLDGEGVYVAEVTGDNAKKAGFKKLDKILTFNGKDVESSDDLIRRVRECKVGDKVTVGISRDGQKITIKTELEELVTTQQSK
ncbi:MAG: trypsin-like peptidase domain-containing protein [Clostridiales bacterium]|nr:trypsin-like peptidase domain-containing protein [Candidatus Crickella equi]